MTSVNVASRLGVTQSATYRHIRDMDELNELASYAVVNELNSVMMVAFSAPETAWGDGAHFAKFAERVVGLMVDHQQGFAVIDRWRYLDGVLGAGIRSGLDTGAQLVAGELEIAWRGGFSYDGDFDGATRAAQLAHAQLIIDDAVAVARGVGTGTAAQRRKGDTHAQSALLRRLVRVCAGDESSTRSRDTATRLPIAAVAGRDRSFGGGLRMTPDDVQPELSRRGQAISHAADLLREGGPDALTSVAVAGRMGISQSAVYRHVRDVEELSALAAEVVVSEMTRTLNEILLDPAVDSDEMDDVGHMCGALIDLMTANERSFAIVDQWRFVEGALGAGIRKMIGDNYDMIAAILEFRWREEFGGDAKLTTKERTAIAAHGRALHDDGCAVARLARSPGCPFGRSELADILQYRVIAGWSVFAIDMNDLVGLPFPTIDLTSGMAVDAARTATSISC